MNSAPARLVPPAVLANQYAIFAGLLNSLRPHWRKDRALPARIEALIRGDRRFGSRDRRLYRELVYTALRILPWIEDRPVNEAVALIARHAADSPATTAFRARHGADPLPAGLDPDALLPAWLRDEAPDAFAPRHRDALLTRASLWLRLQTDDQEAVRTEFSAAGWPVEPSAVLPEAWRLRADVDVTGTKAFQEGRIEIQDLGSQLILTCAAPQPGGHWLDACAGAGGKALQLARMLGPDGRVTAHDIRPAALAELQARAQRACLRTISIIRHPEGSFDGVLVDAPCSGSGTWRRAPHLKWTTCPADLAAAARLQGELLLRFSRYVRPGGRLVYATCSLCRSENEDVIARFLAATTEFAVEPLERTFGYTQGPLGLTLLPGIHDTDGFFVCSLRHTTRE